MFTGNSCIINLANTVKSINQIIPYFSTVSIKKWYISTDSNPSTIASYSTVLTDKIELSQKLTGRASYHPVS